MPIIKLTVLSLLYSFSSAIAEPLADKKIVNVLEQIGGTFKVLLAIMFCIAALLIIGIAIILKISNTGLMLRLDDFRLKHLRREKERRPPLTGIIIL